MIEALAALAIVAVALAAIGSLVAFNVRGTARLEQQLALIETTRAVLASQPPRRDGPDVLGGDLDGYRWQMRLRAARSESNARWFAQTATVTVQNSSGRPFQVETIRLRRAADRRE